MTPEQLTTLRTWINTQPTRDTSALLALIYARPITGYTEWNEERARNPVIVAAEKQMKAVAASAGITGSDTPAQIQAKLLAWIDAGTTAQKPERCFKAAVALSSYIMLRTVDVSGAYNETIPHHDPIYGQSIAQELDIPSVTGNDIERAIRK